MASLIFFRMEINFPFIRSNYNKSNFKKFVLQPFVPDAKNHPNEFALLIYALDNKDEVIEKQDLTVDNSFSFTAKNRVEFGNIPFSKKEVKYFIDADQPPGKIISLVFKPYDYGDYVAYRVKANPEVMAGLGEYDLKPSPPAPPEEAEMDTKHK